MCDLDEVDRQPGEDVFECLTLYVLPRQQVTLNPYERNDFLFIDGHRGACAIPHADM